MTDLEWKNRLTTKSYLSLLYLRQFLVEDLWPDNIINDLPFLGDKAKSFTVKYSNKSRPVCVRELLIHLYRNETNENVVHFIKIILQNQKNLLPEKANKILEDEKELLKETITFPINHIPENYYPRPHLCRQAIEWICTFENLEFFGNDDKPPTLLLISGEEGSGKTAFSTELFECPEMRQKIPLAGLIKIELFDGSKCKSYFQVLSEIYGKLRESVKRHGIINETEIKLPDENVIDKCSEIKENINQIMLASARPADRILLILDHANSSVFSFQECLQFLTFNNIITLIITNDKQLANQFHGERKFEMPSEFTVNEWHGFLKHYLGDNWKDEWTNTCDRIAQRVGLKPYNLNKIGRHFSISGPDLSERIKYFDSIPVQKLEGYIKFYHF